MAFYANVMRIKLSDFVNRREEWERVLQFNQEEGNKVRGASR